jgi:hypothetical protein
MSYCIVWYCQEEVLDFDLCRGHWTEWLDLGYKYDDKTAWLYNTNKAESKKIVDLLEKKIELLEKKIASNDEQTRYQLTKDSKLSRELGKKK